MCHYNIHNQAHLSEDVYILISKSIVTQMQWALNVPYCIGSHHPTILTYVSIFTNENSIDSSKCRQKMTIEYFFNVFFFRPLLQLMRIKFNVHTHANTNITHTMFILLLSLAVVADY